MTKASDTHTNTHRYCNDGRLLNEPLSIEVIKLLLKVLWGHNDIMMMGDGFMNSYNLQCFQSSQILKCGHGDTLELTEAEIPTMSCLTNNASTLCHE